MVFLFILLLLVVLLTTSKIRIEIEDFRFISNIFKIEQLINPLQKQGNYKVKQQKTNYFNENYNIKIKLLVLGKVPILWSNINKSKIQKFKENKRFKNMNINFKNIKKEVSFTKLKQVTTKININIKKFYLKTEVGTENTILTTMIVPIISSAIAIILAKRKVKPVNQKYQIKPIYNSGNLFNLEFSGIFEIKIKCIIKILIEIVKMKKYKEKKNNKYILKERTAY